MFVAWFRSAHAVSLRSVSLCLLVLLSLLMGACGSSGTQARTSSTPTPKVTVTPALSPTSATPTLLRPDLERGMIYPQYGPNAYGVNDTTWQQGIQAIKTQTASTWLEIPVLLQQPTIYSTSIGPAATAPNLDAFANGIHAAQALGFHVFFVPLLGVNTQGDWSGVVQIASSSQQTWFDNYWQALQPYAQVAQQNGVEQMAIGTELVWLEQNAPASLWNQLIARVQSVFKGTLTYDMNWYPSLSQAPQSWMKNPALAKIGVSEYIPLSDTPAPLDPKSLPGIWNTKVGKLIDTFSSQVGKQIIITEIGYRNSSDALYNPYAPQSTAPNDEQEQAAAYDAALTDVFADSHIAGIFFWGWDNVGRLAIAGQQAVQVVDRWYTSMSS